MTSDLAVPFVAEAWLADVGSIEPGLTIAAAAIAIWNLGTLVAGGAIVAGDRDPVRAQLRGLAVLSTLFGVNHAVAAAQSGGKPGNIAWAVINGGGVVSALAALASERPARR